MRFLPEYNAHLIVETEICLEAIKQDKDKYGDFGILSKIYKDEIKKLGKWFNCFGLRTCWIVLLQSTLKLVHIYEENKLKDIPEKMLENFRGYAIRGLQDVADDYRSLYKLR